MGARLVTIPRTSHLVFGAALLLVAALVPACGSDTETSASRSIEPASTESATTQSTRPDPVSTIGSPTTATLRNQGGRLSAPVETPPSPLVIDHASLTTQNWATYDYTTDAASVTASAPADLTDMNVREIFWRADERPSADQQTCITWRETAGSVTGQPIQPGLAMRIASVGPHNEGVKAVTLTENVMFAGVWLFNVHVWDTTSATPMTLLKTVDASKVVGRISSADGRVANLMVKPPWHLCGRTVGNTFSFKVWTRHDPEPSWNDPNHVFSVPLPTGWDYSGYAGGYIGHLHPGQFATATMGSMTSIVR